MASNYAVMRSGSDEELLQEIRDRYKQYDTAWSRIRDERNIDLKYICGDPWSAKDRKARDDAGRPAINHDELNQYINQTVGNVRQNKRGIKIDPAGEGSSDQTATLRQDLVRTIEYNSNAPSIYSNAYQDMVEGSYAFFRISRRFVSDNLNVKHNQAQIFDQEIVIKSIANPNSVLYDPNCKEPDWSDAEACFVLERVHKKEFARRWPKAQISSFSADYRTAYADWFPGDDVLVAEYWRVEKAYKTWYLLANGDVTDKPGNRSVEAKRVLAEKTVVQYVTNGIEILDRMEQPGTILPIIPMVGLERYLDEGGFSRRVLFSLVRLARDPQMSLAYLNSQEMEEAGLSPKVPFLGYKGQFDSNRQMWRDCTKIPYAFLEADIPDNWPAGQVPPLPQRVPFTPNFQSYEVAKESCRRAIQSAMGTVPMPTSAQRDQEKSGVALSRIEEQQATGAYHFVDAYDRALRLAGKVILEWIPATYETTRHLHIRKEDDRHKLITLNTAAPYADHSTQKPVHYPVDESEHAVSVSTGPSYASQRQAADEFLDGLIGQLPKLPIAPPQAAKLLAIAIKMKELGPQGDQMAEIIDPSLSATPDQSAQQLQQAQQAAQQQGIVIQQLQAELQKLTMEKQAKVIESQTKIVLERMRALADLELQRMKADTQLAAAEVSTKSQIISERVAAVEELYRQAHDQLHEARSQAADQQHQLTSQYADQQHQMALAQQQQAHEQSLAQQAAAQQPAAEEPPQ